jgi:hypothetical protein
VLADINLLNVGGTLSKFVFLCRVCVDLTQTRVKLRVKKRKFVSNRHKYLCLCVFGNAPVTTDDGVRRSTQVQTQAKQVYIPTMTGKKYSFVTTVLGERMLGNEAYE